MWYPDRPRGQPHSPAPVRPCSTGRPTLCDQLSTGVCHGGAPRWTYVNGSWERRPGLLCHQLGAGGTSEDRRHRRRRRPAELDRPAGHCTFPEHFLCDSCLRAPLIYPALLIWEGRAALSSCTESDQMLWIARRGCTCPVPCVLNRCVVFFSSAPLTSRVINQFRPISSRSCSIMNRIEPPDRATGSSHRIEPPDLGRKLEQSFSVLCDWSCSHGGQVLQYQSWSLQCLIRANRIQFGKAAYSQISGMD